MTISTPLQRRHFLDTGEAETTADLTKLGETLSEAAQDAESLGMSDVKEHLDAALDGVENVHTRQEA